MVDTTRIVKSPMPMIYPRGTQDLSIENSLPDPINKPIHLPLMYLSTERGRLVPEIVTLNDAYRLFGEKTFQQRGKFFTHQTKLALKLLQAGQSVMIKRLEPTSASVKLPGDGIMDPKFLGVWQGTTSMPDQGGSVSIDDGEYYLQIPSVGGQEPLYWRVYDGDSSDWVDYNPFTMSEAESNSIFLNGVPPIDLFDPPPVRPNGWPNCVDAPPLSLNGSRGYVVPLLPTSANFPPPALTKIKTDITASIKIKAALLEVEPFTTLPTPGSEQERIKFLERLPYLLVNNGVKRPNPYYDKEHPANIWLRNTDVMDVNVGSYVYDYEGNKVPDVLSIGGVPPNIMDTPNGPAGYTVDPNQEYQPRSQWVLMWFLLGHGDRVEDFIDIEYKSSTMKVYDIGEVAADSYGAWGNNIGFELYAALKDTPIKINEDIVDHQNALEYIFKAYERKDGTNTELVVPTVDGSRYVEFMLKPGGYNYKLNRDLPIHNVIDSYNDDGIQSGTSPIHGVIGKFDLNVEGDLGLSDLITDLIRREAIYRNGTTFQDSSIPLGNTMTWADVYPISTDPAEQLELIWRIDPFTAHDSTINLPLFSVGFSMRHSEVFRPGHIHFLRDGEDGPQAGETQIRSEVDNLYYDIYDIRVEREIKDYYDVTLDNGRSLLDHARFPFSCVYDSGFDVNVKKAIPLWMGYRDDVNVAISTVIAGDNPPDLEDELALAADLYNNAIMVIPESEYFGTDTYRCVLMMQGGKLINDTYLKWLPTTFELALKRADYMGAPNGKMRGERMYTRSPLNQVRFMKQLTNTYMKEAVRLNAWALGLNYAEYADNRLLYYAALHTVYATDNSVLTGERFMNIVTEVKKQSNIVYTKIVGRDDLTDAQFIDEWNRLMEAAVAGKFHESVTIIPDCYFTPRDEALGYTWVGRTHIFGNVAKTVQQTEVLVYRTN